jgi:IclR family pca regulon transcriptional regulator
MTDETLDSPASADFVQSLARGLAVIRAFDAAHPHLTLSEAARRTGLTRAATRRFLLTLESLGYVRSDGRAFSLTPRVLDLGFSYLSALSLPEILQPHLEQLSHDVEESVSAAVLDGPDVVYIARVPTRRIMSVRITIGTRFPAYATSMGRAIWSELSDSDLEDAIGMRPLEPLTEHTITSTEALRRAVAVVRAQGWAMVDGELERGLRSIAVPIHGRDGGVVCAVNVSTSSTRDTAERVRELHVPRLLSAATRIEADLRLV